MRIRTAGCIRIPVTAKSCDEDEDAPTVLLYAHFRPFGVCGHLLTVGSFCIPLSEAFRQKGMQMKLRIRYENEWQTMELDDMATEELWVTLSLEGNGLAKSEKEKLIQQTWEERFNRPDYNNWHKFDRHWGNSSAQTDDEDGDDIPEPLMSEVADDRIFRKDEIEWEEKEERDEVCRWVRTILAKKPKWAEAFIAVRINGVSVNDYAASVGVKDASAVSKWLTRAEKKLRDSYRDR